MAERASLPIRPKPQAKQPAAARETTERKIYVLPTEQVERIKAYQASAGISSEVEAVRRLLDVALEMRDTSLDLLNKMKSRFSEEKDLRVLAKDIVAGHSKLVSFRLVDDGLEFTLSGDDHGKINHKGRIFYGEQRGYEMEWTEIQPLPPPPVKKGGYGWDAPKTDLDDDIPF